MVTLISAFSPFYMDRYYVLLVLPAMVLALIAQSLVNSRFRKYSEIRAASGYTGEQAAERILRDNQLFDVRIERTPGKLTDHYSPQEKVLRLSDSTHQSSSIAAIGVAAHEAGHAVQDATGYLPNRIRAALVPVARIGSGAGPYLALIGLFMQTSFGDIVFNLGLFLYLGAVLFYVVTLPVEFDASRRALATLTSTGLLSSEEMTGARKVLGAAALTYVASAITAFASLLRIILLSRSRRRD